MTTRNTPVSGWTVTKADRALARELQQRLPDRLFDVHMHLYRQRDVRPISPVLKVGPSSSGLAVWQRCLGQQVGAKRLCGALCTPFPSKEGDREAATRFTVAEAGRRKGYAATMLVSPASDPGAVERFVEENPLVAGFKPYHLLAAGKDTYHADLGAYLPEWVWKIAHRRRLVILVHLVKDGALADRGNQKYITRLCAKYPDARLILAHAARGFHAPNTVRGLAALRGLENVWFDSSAICETEPLAAILDEFGPKRLMWGSDFPVSQQRGRAVTLGTGFAWVVTDQLDWGKTHFMAEPVVVGLESLRALLGACEQAGLNADDLRDVFCDNARRLLRLEPEGANATQALYRKARELIPGGVQLLSKRPEMGAPGQWPAYFSRARGCEIWDLDGKHYYDCSFHGIGANLLGFCDPDVNRAVRRRVSLGNYCTLNSPEEVELAERLCALHPWAQQARFTRTGGEAMAVAVRIARATTDRSAVAVCGYHGWHDWYLASNLGDNDSLRGHLLPGLAPLGVPRELRGTAFPFTYNNRDQFGKIIAEQGSRLAAVVMEPCRGRDPEPGFLEFVRDEAHKAGALLVFDEITIGWRLNYGGAHLRLGVNPDLAVFGKSLANSYPMAAIIGTRAAMDGAHGSFISSSFWTEGVGPVAALATLEKMRRIDVPGHCRRIGARVQEHWRALSRKHGLPVQVDDTFPALAHFAFKHEKADVLKTLYVQLMLGRGFLARDSIYVTLAHTDEVIDRYAAAIDEVFGELARMLAGGDPERHLKGPVAHSGFRRLL